MTKFYAVLGIGNLEKKNLEKLRDREIAKIGSHCRCVSSVREMGVRAIPATSIKVYFSFPLWKENAKWSYAILLP
jgi:hypothetical protein